jgi:hypothetical protein
VGCKNIIKGRFAHDIAQEIGNKLNLVLIQVRQVRQVRGGTEPASEYTFLYAAKFNTLTQLSLPISFKFSQFSV